MIEATLKIKVKIEMNELLSCKLVYVYFTTEPLTMEKTNEF